VGSAPLGRAIGTSFTEMMIYDVGPERTQEMSL
jgi:hypothetical protein